MYIYIYIITYYYAYHIAQLFAILMQLCIAALDKGVSVCQKPDQLGPGYKSSRHVYPVARLGIKKMTKEEADKVCISNKNRSHAKLRSTQGFIDVPLLLVGKV